MNYRDKILFDIVQVDVKNERVRQNAKWGRQRHTPEKWLSIAIEEVGEMAQAMQKEDVQHKGTDADDLYTETIHAIAVLTAQAEQLAEERLNNGQNTL